MNAPAIILGPRVADDIVVFRAFAEKSFRDRKKNKVRYFAYLLRDDEVQNGVSVGLTPAAAVRHLDTNEGYCSISVGAIHALRDDLEVRYDANDPEHAYICNLPLATSSDEQFELARFLGGELARKSNVVTCDPFIP